MQPQTPFGFTPDDEMNPTYCRRCRAKIPAAMWRAQRGMCARCLQMDTESPAYTFGSPAVSAGGRVMIWGVVGCLGFLLLLMVIGLIGDMASPPPSPRRPPVAQQPADIPPPPAPAAPAPEPPAAPSSVDLNAAVRFDGAQFIIANNDGFDWTNARLTVNEGFLRGGYVYETGRMEAGEVYTVGAMQFAEGDGERFNPFTHKVKTLSIHCDTSIGARGHWFGGF